MSSWEVRLQSIAAITGLVGGAIVGELSHASRLDPFLLSGALIAGCAMLAIVVAFLVDAVRPQEIHPSLGVVGLIFLTSFGNAMLILAIYEKRSLVIPNNRVFNVSVNAITLLAMILFTSGRRRAGILMILLFALTSTGLFFLAPAGW